MVFKFANKLSGLAPTVVMVVASGVWDRKLFRLLSNIISVLYHIGMELVDDTKNWFHHRFIGE